MPEVRAFPSIPTKILLPIDFSPSSQAALEMAADLAQHFHAELYLVNVIPYFPTTTLPDLIPETEFVQEARTFAEQHLAKCHAALAARGVKSTSSVEIGNDIAGNIIEVIEREHIDMVVISTHGISAGCRIDCREGRQAGAMSALASSLNQARDWREEPIRTIRGMVVMKTASQVA
jgi:nucleotide-binding universal stress UspA family protein